MITFIISMVIFYIIAKIGVKIGGGDTPPPFMRNGGNRSGNKDGDNENITITINIDVKDDSSKDGKS